MKTIKLLVEIEVPDNYQMDEPMWTLEDAINNTSDNIEILDVKNI